MTTRRVLTPLMKMNWIRPFAGPVVVFCLAAGCAAIQPAKPPMEILWPPPPDPPVIAFERTFSEPRDLGPKRGWFSRIARYLFGEGPAPHMIRPYAVAADAKGRVFITDTGLQVVHVYDFPRKDYRQLYWIRRGVSRLGAPVGVALDDDGRLYVSDSQHNRIFVYDPGRGRLLQTIGDPGRYKRLTGIAFDRKRGFLYAADTDGNQVIVFDREGRELKIIGRRGTDDGEFNFPTHVTVDAEGRIYVTDSMNFRVQIFDPDGKFLGKLGRLGNTLGSFSKPKGVAVDPEGHVYVVDGIYDTIQIFGRTGELLMNFGKTGENQGDFYLPSGIAIDAQNKIYVADTYNQRVQVFNFLGVPKPQEASEPEKPTGPPTP